MPAAQWGRCPRDTGLFHMLEHPLGSASSRTTCGGSPQHHFLGVGRQQGTVPVSMLVGMGGRCGQAHNQLLTGAPPQAYVNMALFENFTYAGIDATAEEA